MELMIVIVIIGVIYTLAVSKLQHVAEQKQVPSFLNLKEYLLSYIKEDAQDVRLLCLDDCEKCYVYVDGVSQEEAIEPFFDSSVEVYRYDFSQGLVQLQDAVFFNEEGRQENVCFTFSMSKNLISDQVIVVYKEKAYDYSAYFEGVKMYNHLGELSEEKERLAQVVSR